MRDIRWNIERTTPTPPTRDVAALRQEVVNVGGKSAAMGFLCKQQMDAKILADLQGSGQQTNLERHNLLMTTLAKFPKAMPAGHDLADFFARHQELDAISAYEAALEQHRDDVRLEVHVRAVNLRTESDTIADAIVEAARRPGADAELVAAAAQVTRHDEDHRGRIEENQGKVEKAKKGAARDLEQMQTQLQQREAEILELRRQLGLRLAADAALSPPAPGSGGGGSSGRNIPR